MHGLSKRISKLFKFRDFFRIQAIVKNSLTVGVFMFKFSHPTLIVVSGLIWLAIGSFLMSIGLNFLVESGKAPTGTYAFLDWLAKWFDGKDQAVVLLLVAGLLIGYLKGRMVLGKAARKGADRIRSFPNPTSLVSIYSARYLVLIAIMIGIGISFRVFNLSHDIRGFVDIAIGAALLNGSMIYFRIASQVYREESRRII